MRSATSAVDWVESLSPWPRDGFGLERMRRLLSALGDPQARFPAIHVVGTNGKSTTTRMIAALLENEGMRTGSTISPHVQSVAERIQIGGADVDIEAAFGRVREAAVAEAATQFETIIAAALTAFAEGGVAAAVVEAGLGGRLDATNVLDSRVVVLTNVALEHMDVLGDTREAIAREKLAVIRPGVDVVLGEHEWEQLARDHGAGSVRTCSTGLAELAACAASGFLGRQVPTDAADAVSLPGRLERRSGEIRDGAHNPHAARYLVDRIGAGDRVIVMAVLRDKDAVEMLRILAEAGSRLVATTTSSGRAVPADELGSLARDLFADVTVEADPARALARAHELGGEVLVTGSLTLLADLAKREAGG